MPITIQGHGYSPRSTPANVEDLSSCSQKDHNVRSLLLVCLIQNMSHIRPQNIIIVKYGNVM